MKTTIYTLSLLLPSLAGANEFQEPVQLKGGDQLIETESLGDAAPCLHDLDGDGKGNQDELSKKMQEPFT